MYTRYFGLTEKPFAIAPNPRFLYMSELHREALAHLIYGINGEGCIVLFTGEVGTGKTTVCRCLVEQLPDTTDIAIILNPKLTILDLLKTICEELAIPIIEEYPTVKTYIDSLNKYLLATHSRGRNTAIIIDEAQNLDLEVLEQLRLLTNLETDTHKLLQIVLVGQPELRGILEAPDLSQISQRITARYHLEPLQQKDVSAYIHHRMVIAGRDLRAVLFPEKAIRMISKHSKGIPRLINIICDRALLGAYAENKAIIDVKIVKKAIGEVINAERKNSLFKDKIIVAVLLVFMAISLPVLVFYAINGEVFSVVEWLSRPEKTNSDVMTTPAVPTENDLNMSDE